MTLWYDHSSLSLIMLNEVLECTLILNSWTNQKQRTRGTPGVHILTGEDGREYVINTIFPFIPSFRIFPTSPWDPLYLYHHQTIMANYRKSTRYQYQQSHHQNDLEPVVIVALTLMVVLGLMTLFGLIFSGTSQEQMIMMEKCSANYWKNDCAGRTRPWTEDYCKMMKACAKNALWKFQRDL